MPDEPAQDWIQQLTASLEPKLKSATASLLQQEVELNLQKTGVLDIAEVHDHVDTMGKVTAIYLPIMGDVVGDIFTFLPDESANHVVDLMMGNSLGTTKLIGEFETSALKEFGNITSGVIVTELANSLNISMILTVPNLATDMVGALVDQVLIEYGASGTNLLAIEMQFVVSDHQIDGTFLTLFDQNTSDLIRSKLVTP